MIFNRDKSLIISSVLFLAITGSFMLGCKENSDTSPVGALIGDINSDNFKSGSRTLVGNFTTNYYKDDLGGIPVSIAKFVKDKNAYVEFDKTVTSLEGTQGKFKFTGLNAGSYKITTPKTKIFKSFEGVTMIKENANASDSTTLSDIDVNYTLPHITDEMNGLKIKVVSANNGKIIDSATVKIDNKAVNVTNENGITEVDGVNIGFHNIEVSRDGYQKLAGKFEIQEAKSGNVTINPTVFGNNPMQLCLVEPGHECSITGRYYAKDDTKPKYVALYKYELNANIDNIEYYKVNFLKMTKTSYGIDGTPDGSFKFLDLPEGFYQIHVYETNQGHPEPKTINPLATDTSYLIYNLSNYDKADIANYRWQPLSISASERTSRPIYVKPDTTVYWTNIDTLSTK